MNAVITQLLGLSGYAFVGVICGLMVLEELGIPLRFAPGDLLLVLAGASIATGHVNPFVMVTAAYVSLLLGAFGGRELFARIGPAAPPRVAALLHPGDRVDRLAARLRNGGSAAVFLGRITPGLPMYTSEISGLVGMRRRTFLIGLAPAIALYEAVFISLGFWLGPTALTAIEHHGPKPEALLLLLVIAAGLALAGHAVVTRPRRRARRAERPICRRRWPRSLEAATMSSSSLE